MASSTISLGDLTSLVFNLATVNLGYLTIAIAIIAILGGVFYFFNIKPIADAIEKQKADFTSMKEGLGALSSQVELKLKELEVRTISTEARIDKEVKTTVDFATNKISELSKDANEKIKLLKNEVVILKVTTEWNEQYIWRALKVPENVYRSLQGCLKSAITNNVPQFASLAVGQLAAELGSGELNKTHTTNDEIKTLVMLLDKVPDMDKEKDSIKKALS